MNLHLRYSHTGVIHPGQLIPRVPADDSTIRLHFAVCDEDGAPLETLGGKYESDYTDSYLPHREEREMLERIEILIEDMRFQIASTPHPAKPHYVRFEAVMTLPFEIELGQIQLK